MKFKTSALNEAAAKPPIDDKKTTSNPPQHYGRKGQSGIVLPKAKMISKPNTHYIRVTIPQHPSLSTVTGFENKAYAILQTMLEHLLMLDPTVVLSECKDWLESGEETAKTRVVSTPLSLSSVIKGENWLTPELVRQFIELFHEKKRDSNTTTYGRFCLTCTRNVKDILALIRNSIKEERSNIRVDLNLTREIIDAVAGWFLGLDPVFANPTIIQGCIRNLLIAKHGEKNVPSFYVKRTYESTWVTSIDERSKAPVIRILCDLSGLSTLRKMLHELPPQQDFTKFVSQAIDKTVKWAFINDHIDELDKKKYLFISGPSITTCDEILKEICQDSTGKEGILYDLLTGNGITAIQQTALGKKILLAQIHADSYQKALDYLNNEFVKDKTIAWSVTPKTFKRDMIKGKLTAAVPTLLTTTRRPASPSHSVWTRTTNAGSNTGGTTIGQSIITSKADENTITTLKTKLSDLSNQCKSLKADKMVLKKQLEEANKFRLEFEEYKRLQTEREAEQQKQILTMQTEQQSLANTNEYLRTLMEHTSGISTGSEVMDLNLSMDQPPEDIEIDNIQNLSGEFQPARKRGKALTTRRDGQMMLHHSRNHGGRGFGPSTSSPNRFQLLATDDDKSVDANSDSHSTYTASVNVPGANLSTTVAMDGEDE